MPIVEKQWTKKIGVVTKKPVGWSTRRQVMRYKKLQRKQNAAWVTSDEYTYSYEDSASPDTDGPDTTGDEPDAEAASQPNATDEATTSSGALAVFHMEHLIRHLSNWHNEHKN